MLALDPLACGEIWADGAHSCVRDERHAGPHRCDCGKTRRRAPKPEAHKCGTCGTELVRQAGEQAGNFRRRKYCNSQCRWAAEPSSGQKLDLANLGVAERIGKFRVYWAKDGRPFVLRKTPGRVGRMYGEISDCQRCGKRFFHRPTGQPRWRHCSKKCAGYSVRATKRSITLGRGGPKRGTLDKWFSVIVRAEGACRRCGATSGLQCAHVVSRRYQGVRFARDNAMCLCARCHMYFTHRPLEWEEYVETLMGEEAFAALKRRARAFQGPLDRKAIAEDLYRQAAELDLVYHNAFKGATFAGIYDDESERAHRELSATQPSALQGLQQEEK